MRNNTVETLVGVLLVALVAGGLFFAYTSSQTGGTRGYELNAKFNSADGITTGTDIRLHGVKVGTISSVDLDRKTYLPLVHLAIRGGIRIPEDSAVRVASAGILGNSYLDIRPGNSKKMLAAGGSIPVAPGAAGLAGLIDQITNSGSK
jgi:phospholipid/cholesterol/gamma-HCH transport system substrate-binding protein